MLEGFVLLCKLVPFLKFHVISMQLVCARTFISMFLADKQCHCHFPSLVKLGPRQTLINTLWLSEPAWPKNNCMQVMPTVFLLSDGFLVGVLAKACSICLPFSFSTHDGKLLHFSELRQCHNRYSNLYQVEIDDSPFILSALLDSECP